MTYTNERRKTLFSRIIKQLIVLNIAILLLIVGYKVYLGFHEPDFQASNIENIKQVEERGLGDTYSYVVFGSIESSINVFQNKIIHKINEDPSINFAVSTGDAVLDGAEDKYQILHRSLNKLEIPKLVGAGDGEIADGGDIRFYQHFGPYYFSFYSGNSYFIFVDTTGMTTVAFQKDWILQELNKADKFTNVFVFMNDAPIKTASNNLIQASHYIASRSFREFLIRELANHKVDGVFTNGSILYEKKLAQGVPYYISGGSGGLLNQGSKGIAFHYLKVNVSPKGVDVQSISQPVVSSQVLVQKIERLWIYIHSIFYVNFTNILLGTFAALLIFLIVYNRASRGVDYYRDFKASETEIPVKEKLTIAMSNGTKNLAEKIALGIESASPETEVKVFNIAKSDQNDLITEVFKSKAVVIGSPTIGNGVLHSVAGFLYLMKSLKFKNKKAAGFGCYGWSGESPKIIGEMLTQAGFELVCEPLRYQWNPDENALKAAVQFGKEFAQKLGE